MPIQKQIVPLPLAQGIDAGGTDPKVVQGQMLKCENAVFDRRARVAKRYGVTSSGQAANATILGARKDEGIAYGTGDLYSFDESNAPAAQGSKHLYRTSLSPSPVYSRPEIRYQQVLYCTEDGEVATLNFSTLYNSSPYINQTSTLYIRSKKDSNGDFAEQTLIGTVETNGTPSTTGDYITAATAFPISGGFRICYITVGYSSGYAGAIFYQDVTANNISSATGPTITNSPFVSTDALNARTAGTGQPYILDSYHDGTNTYLAYNHAANGSCMIQLNSSMVRQWEVTSLTTNNAGPVSIFPVVISGTTYYAHVYSMFRRNGGNGVLSFKIYDDSGSEVYTGGTHSYTWANASQTTLQQLCGIQSSDDDADLLLFYNATNDAAGAYSYSSNMLKVTLAGTPASGTTSPGTAVRLASGFIVASKPLKDSANDAVHLIMEGPVLHELPNQVKRTGAVHATRDVATQHTWMLVRVLPDGLGTEASPAAIIVGKGPYGLNGRFVIQNRESNIGTTEGRRDQHYSMRGLTQLSETTGRGIGAALTHNDFNTDGTTHVLPITYYHSETSGGAGYLTVNTRVSEKIRPVEGNGVAYLPNSCAYEYDGEIVAEQGFLSFPELIGATIAAGSGSWDNTGLVSFYCIYEWVDAEGNVHQSAPSFPYTVTIEATTDEVTIEALAYPSFGRKKGVRLALYRTAINGDAPYRIQTVDALTNNGNTVTFSASGGDEEITVDVGDKSFPRQDILYTYNNSLENLGPEPHFIAEVHQARYCHVPYRRRDTTVLYGQQYTPGRGTEHNPALEIKVSAEGGNITGLSSMDEKLLIFKEDRCLAVSGEGVNRTGSGNGYEQARLISSSVGCVDNRIMKMIPMGMLFLSKQGIHLLGRDERLNFIGERVRYYTDTYTYTGLSVDSIGHVAVFTSASGPALVYDYMYDQWGTWTGAYDSISSIVGLNDRLAVIDSSGNIDISDDSSTNYLDDSTSYSIKLETSWISLNKLLGYQRVYDVRIMMDNISDHTLRVKTAYDRSPYWVDSQTFDSTTLEEWGESAHFGAMSDSADRDEEYVVELGVSQSRCEAIRFQITDEDPAVGSTAQALTISGMALRVGMHPGFGNKPGKDMS